MKIAIIGPAHPYKGGIVQETTELAHRLQARGNDVEIMSWNSQYPKRLYPGSVLPLDQPELTPFPNTTKLLNWYDPLSWRRAGKHARQFDQVIFVWWFPTMQAPIYLTILKQLKQSTKATVICHNVLPHESKPGDRILAKRFFGRIDQLLVHTSEQAVMANQLTNQSIKHAQLPPLLPGWSAKAATTHGKLHHNLLFFGIVRDYKGLDIVLEALAKTEGVRLTIAGEFWGGTAAYEAQIDALGIKERVSLHAGYVANEKIQQLFAEADALVLPYRSATGTTNVRLGFAYKIPVIASDIPALAQQISDGKNGLLFASENPDSLAAAITKLYRPGMQQILSKNLPIVAIDSIWDTYLNSLLK